MDDKTVHTVNRGQRNGRSILRNSFESDAGHSPIPGRLEPSTGQGLSKKPKNISIA
jgi:hypothetical protein